ncbi:MAG: nucleotide exchange factor GrpE [Oscillospiraceae bacterium]|nr:nucleotide exchange factor GrpE [Clostridiales bacterium]MDY2961746.1 nucleotide exchange factor GrpE [Oscillospiraceae bacterium]MDD6077450.1 nucleotide exchange factor GrpE [Clostridiales bacterium]MDD6935556.1 nucleotide exchange factor GrpE [Clostridiales bacterium]MDY5594573.1 nucleotide exchange factor GrpE [Oscillospiraceae bacterium]
MSNNKQETAPEKEQTTPETEAEVKEETKAAPEAEQKPDKKAEKKSEKAEKKSEKAPTKKSLEEELAAERDKYLRLLAEYDNFRRRSAKERENIYTDVRCETLKKFLPVYDSLSRALAQTPEDDACRKGLEMIMTQYEKSLEQLGVVMIEAVGQPFDANLHNAVMHIEDENYGENVIVEEFEKGFKIGDKILRYSMVKVAN